MKRITKLTPAQEASLPAIRDEWLAHGLSTQPANRAEAEAGVRAAYLAAGLEPPRFIIWLGSPWTGAIAQAITPHIISRHLAGVDAQVDDQVGAQVDAQVGAQVNAQVYAQVRAQVDDQVGAQVDAQVNAQVYDQVYAQVRDQVDAQVGAQVYDQVYAQVGAQVDDQVGAQVNAQVGAQVNAQVDAQVRAQVNAQVYAQVNAQVGAQVYAQVYDQVYAQVGRRLSGWHQARMAGAHWAGYYSWLDAMARIGVTGLEPIKGQAQVARNAGWWWCYRHFAIVTDRPAVLCRDPLNRLHCADGPAVRYRDGWAMWAWHGRRVPQWVIEQPTVERIGAEDNIEVRRCAIESLGWEKFTGQLLAGQRPVVAGDPGNPGQDLFLYEVPERLWGTRVKLLLCTNGSAERDGTRRRYGLTVPAHIKDPVEAAAWTAGLTKGEYALMQRRT